MKSSRRGWIFRSGVGCVAVSLVACSKSDRLIDLSSGADNPASNAVSLSAPESILTMRSVNLDNLYAEVVINDQPPERFMQSTPVTSEILVARGDVLTIAVTWYEIPEQDAASTIVRDENLALATWSMERQITEHTEIAPSADDYTSTGSDFDLDADGESNLSERRVGSDPYNRLETTNTIPDVRINRIDPANEPTIDGQYDAIWNEATGSPQDQNEERFFVDNLIVDQMGAQPNRETGYFWFAMHDDTNLYVTVFGKQVESSTSFRDSENVRDDDSVNLFIDGDNSKASSYDSVDDRYFAIPLLTDQGDLTENSTTVVKGTNSTQLPEIEFDTCLCSEGWIRWEIKLPIEDLGIRIHRPFGFDVQLDVDNNGGPRDFRWAWYQDVQDDVDSARITPSLMGTAVLK